MLNAELATDRAFARASLKGVRDLVRADLDSVLDRRRDVSYKADGSPVTLADTYLESEILNYLSARHPGLTAVAEEGSPEGFASSDGVLAVLDPIDGTENFCSGLKEWGVSLGLWLEGAHLGTLLMMPELGEWMVSGSDIETFDSRITGFSSSYHPDISTGIEAAGEYRVSGCATYNIMNVIRGSFSRFINPKGAYIWDLLPGALLALENGCDVFIDEEPYDGRLLQANQKYRIEIRHRYDRHPRQGGER